MKFTARKVAHDLGVSTATVSLAMNNRPGVNEETKKRVMDYIKLLQVDYETAETDGKSLKVLLFTRGDYLEDYRGKPHTNEFLQTDCAHICRLLQEHGMSLKLNYASSVEEIERVVLESETDGTIGILLYFDEAPGDILNNLHESKIPLIMYDAPLPEGRNDCDVINLHDVQAVNMAMNYLRKCGHENIAYFYNEGSYYNFVTRRNAFRLYMEQWKGKVQDGQMHQVSTCNDCRESDIEKYFNSIDKLPDAILSENYAISLALMRVINKRNLKVPEEISVLGIDDPSFYAYTDIDYTCIEVPIYERHTVMMKHLLERLNEKEHCPVEILLGMKLKIQNTVKDKSIV